MQPGVTVVLATVWLVVSVGMVGAATHHPAYLTLDQYSPLPPYHHGVYRRVEGQLNWKNQNPAENQPFDLSIGPRRSISTNESPRRPFEVKYPGKDFILPRVEHDAASPNDDFSSLGENKQSRNFAGSKFAEQHKGTNLPELLSHEIPPSELEDPFVADETFQDQGPGSVEIYKLDLVKEKSLLSPTTSTRPPMKSKSKMPKKTSRLDWKSKTAEYKTTSPKAHYKQSNSFEESRTEVPPHSESFGTGGVPELQVGCEGLEASAHKLKRSIDPRSKEKTLEPVVAPWMDVTPISLDLDYELSTDEGYEEMDELLKLKKLETTTKRAKQNRGDMEATLHSDDFLPDKRRLEKLPVRGDLGKSSIANHSAISPTTSITGNQKSEEKTSLIGPYKEANLHSDKVQGENPTKGHVSPSDFTANQPRKLLWLDHPDSGGHSTYEKRTKRSMWGYGEDEGVVSSDELQTEHQRRRQEYERRLQDQERRRQEYERRRLEDEKSHDSVDNQTRPDVDNIGGEYERMLEQRKREEEERMRRNQQHESRGSMSNDRRHEEQLRREEQHRREQEESRRRTNERSRNQLDEERRRHEEEMQRRNRWEDEERRRQEPRTTPRTHHRPKTLAGEEDVARRRRPNEEETRGRSQQREERRRHEAEEERKRQMREREMSRNGQSRGQDEYQRRRQQEQDQRSLEERQREWSMKKRMEEEEERRRRERNRNEGPSNVLHPFRSSPNQTRPYDTEADRRLREQQDREREQKLREYIQRNRPIHVNRSTDRRREEMDRRRMEEERREEEERRPDTNRRRLEEERRAEAERRRMEEERRAERTRMEEERRRLEEERRAQMDRTRVEEERRPETDRRRMEEERRRLEEERRPETDRRRMEEERRRLEEERRPETDRRRMEEERRRLEEERRPETDRRRMEEERRRLEEERRPEADRRRMEEERRRLEEERRPETDRRRMEEERRAGVNRRRMEEERRKYRPENRTDSQENETQRQLEEERRLVDYLRRNQPLYPSKTNEAYDRNWSTSRKAVDEAKQNNYSRYPRPETGRKNHGPSAPENIYSRGSHVDDAARRQHEARRLEEERRTHERQRHRDEEMRKEALRREEEIRKTQSRRYEEQRKRLEAQRQAEERRNKELIEEHAKRSQAGRPLVNTKPGYEDRRRYEEQRRRQDTSLIPGYLVLNDTRSTVDRTRQRQEQERQRLEAERRRQEENRMKESRQNEEHAMEQQRRRQEEARLNALPVSARIILRSSPSSVPILTSRSFGNEIDFSGINPSRQGVGVSRFPTSPTSRPPTQGPGPCIWAVVQCCPFNSNRLATCFESLGCPGITWDPSPCRASIAQAARAEVMKFYASAENEHFL